MPLSQRHGLKITAITSFPSQCGLPQPIAVAERPASLFNNNVTEIQRVCNPHIERRKQLRPSSWLDAFLTRFSDCYRQDAVRTENLTNLSCQADFSAGLAARIVGMPEFDPHQVDSQGAEN